MFFLIVLIVSFNGWSCSFITRKTISSSMLEYS